MFHYKKINVLVPLTPGAIMGSLMQLYQALYFTKLSTLDFEKKRTIFDKLYKLNFF